MMQLVSPQLAQFANDLIYYTSYTLVCIGVVGLALKTFYYIIIKLSWSYLCRQFHLNYNAQAAKDDKMTLDQIRGESSYVWAIYNFFDYNPATMMGVEEEHYANVAETCKKLNEINSILLKKKKGKVSQSQPKKGEVKKNEQR